MKNTTDIEMSTPPLWLSEDAEAENWLGKGFPDNSDAPDWLSEEPKYDNAPLPKTKVAKQTSGSRRASKDTKDSPRRRSKDTKDTEVSGAPHPNDVESPPWFASDSGVAQESVSNTLDEVSTGNKESQSNSNNEVSAANAASNKTWGEFFRGSFQRDGRLLLVTLGILIGVNIPFLNWGFYPFLIYFVWIHEVCHGIAGLMVGGSIEKLEVFAFSGGLAHVTGVYNKYAWAFVLSAGYQGTAVVGFLLLIFRRTKRGPRTGTMIMGCAMIASCILWIRNIFGMVFISCLGATFVGLAWILPSQHIRNLYMILAVTCALNTLTSIQHLFGGTYVVNGETIQTDAHLIADTIGGSWALWALVWLFLSLFLTAMGFLFAIPGPDEVADFTCCGVCQDFGLFNICNAPGKRWCGRFRGKPDPNPDSPASS